MFFNYTFISTLDRLMDINCRFVCMYFGDMLAGMLKKVNSFYFVYAANFDNKCYPMAYRQTSLS